MSFLRSCRSYFVMLVVALLYSCTVCAAPPVSIYEQEANWAYCETVLQAEKPVDLFLIAPTVDLGGQGSFNVNIEDETLRQNFLNALNQEKGLYSGVAACFAPYYRQATLAAYHLSAADAVQPFALAYTDVKQAFNYYWKTYNQGRPFILAGFSQGAQMLQRLLADPEFRKNRKLRRQLVAAYALGWRLTPQEVANGKLRPAHGALDTGVVISFTTEAPGVNDSLIVPNGMKVLAINPLNWRTDSTPARRQENLGACIVAPDGKIIKEMKQLTGAYLDSTRGTLKLPYIDPEDYHNNIFPDGVYHLYDFMFVYRNLEQNVKERTQAYLERYAQGKGRKQAA